MLYGDEREDHRKVLFDVWQRAQENKPLDAMQTRIWQIIQNHPEYHYIFKDEEKYLQQDFFEEMGEANPFLHLSLHLVLLEQISTNQPRGITKLYQQALVRFGNVHEADHCVMNSLAIALFEVMQQKKTFNEKAYLKRIKIAIKNGYW